MTYYFEDAFYVSINQKQTYLPDKIKDKSLIIQDDIKKIIEQLWLIRISFNWNPFRL